MSTLCTITGTLRDLTGALLVNTQVTFVRGGVAGQDGSTVVPRTVVVTSSGVGAVSVTLYAGNYMATTVGADSGTVAFSVAVPSTATAVLSDLIDAAPTTVTSANVAAVAVSAAASASSATSSAASATSSAASATSSAASATSSAGYATASAASAVNAASVAQQDLSALNIPMTYTPVDVAIDRMADWSDGGFNMRVQQSSKSWYNEVTTATGPWLNEAANETAARLLSGAGTGAYYHNTTDGLFYSLNATSGQTQIFRGGKKSYPEVMGVVAEAGRVILFDLTEPDAPMWKSWDFTGFTITSLAVTNGQIISGTTTGVVVLDLASDDIDVALTYSTSTSSAIVNNAVNDVAITVLPDAPIDPSTGMPVPTIAVATGGNGTYLASVIQPDGNVWDVAADAAATAPSISVVGSRLTVISSTGTAYVWYDIGAIVADGTAPDETYTAASTPAIKGTVSKTETTVLTSPSGATFLKENPAVPTKGIVNYLTTTYLSGWMVGDIRGAWLADTTAETITGAELVTNGTFATATTGWTGVNSTLSIGTANLVVTVAANGAAYAYQAITTVVGKRYVVSANLVAEVTTGNSAIYIGSTAGSGNIASTTATSTAGVQQVTFIATGTATYVSLYSGATALATETATWDGVACRLADPDRSVKGP